mgnify:FL=1
MIKHIKTKHFSIKKIIITRPVVEAGESLGIIGKNGAGKSTLLKILSKITPPTKGRIISRGRIASLLEVGTGFHPELSGRENIFMNGSILGMRKAEIIKNFDAIVDFSGVRQFIDTPLKHYSSGMQLRLAFAVAAFLENEILIIDEVLAVGDAEFQKKCMGKMKDINAKGDRTVLFVSHNIAAIQGMCNTALYLNSGEVHGYGDVKSITSQYVLNQKEGADNKNLESQCKNDRIKIRKILLNQGDGIADFSGSIYRSKAINVIFEVNVLVPGSYNLSVHFKTILNQMICNLYTPIYDLNEGKYSFKMVIPENFLNDEIYYK